MSTLAKPTATFRLVRENLETALVTLEYEGQPMKSLPKVQQVERMVDVMADRFSVEERGILMRNLGVLLRVSSDAAYFDRPLDAAAWRAPLCSALAQLREVAHAQTGSY